MKARNTNKLLLNSEDLSMADEEITTPVVAPLTLPVLPLRDVVVYPYMVIPLFVGRGKSIKSLEAALNTNKEVLLIAQRNPEVDDPKREDLYNIGTIATILQLLKLP